MRLSCCCCCTLTYELFGSGLASAFFELSANPPSMLFYQLTKHIVPGSLSTQGMELMYGGCQNNNTSNKIPSWWCILSLATPAYSAVTDLIMRAVLDDMGTNPQISAKIPFLAFRFILCRTISKCEYFKALSSFGLSFLVLLQALSRRFTLLAALPSSSVLAL